MFRPTVLTLVLTALVPLGLLGCPANEDAGDTELADRGTITTSASAAATASVGDVVELRATATGAADGGTISYAWLQTAGPGVQITNPRQATASFTAPSLETAQNLRFLVTTTNEAGDVGQAEVAVAVSADPNFGESSATSTGQPEANAGDDQTVVGSAAVTLDGSKSKGTSLTYSWSQVSGTTVSLTDVATRKPTFTAPAYDPNGTNLLLFELGVTDNSSRTATDRIQVRVRDPNGRSDQVTVSTSLGDFVMQLETTKAPVSVANFLQYVDEEFYDNTIFHRVIPDFVIQGGGFTTELVQKKTRAGILNEASNGLSNVRTTVAMARTSDPNSATSQFFVNVANNIKGGDGSSDLDPGGVDTYGYAVFAEVIRGMDVCDAIAEVDTETRNSMENVPVTNVVIKSIRRVIGAAVTPE